MTYSVVYKKWSDINNNFVLVEETINADTFVVKDGCLVLLADHGPAIKGIPAGGWAGIDLATPAPSLIQ